MESRTDDAKLQAAGQWTSMPIAPVDPARFSDSGGKRQTRFRGGDER